MKPIIASSPAVAAIPHSPIVGTGLTQAPKDRSFTTTAKPPSNSIRSMVTEPEDEIIPTKLPLSSGKIVAVPSRIFP